jgi:NodT family efflux transporter outer membrane factor (OMF) lipoprotein
LKRFQRVQGPDFHQPPAPVAPAWQESGDPRVLKQAPDFRLNYQQAEIGLSAGWELDFWGKFQRAVESAQADWQASVADYDQALVSLTGDVAGSYILIRTLEKRIDIARRNAEAQREAVKIAEARVRYGTTTQLDVEQAQTVLSNTLASIPALEIQERQARNALSLLLGLPPGQWSEILEGPREIPVSPLQVAVGIPTDLLRRRPDIRGAQYQAEAQSARIGVARADLYPAFSLSGFFGFLSSDVGTSSLTNLFQAGSRTGQIGPSFQWNLFNYGRIKNNIRVQDARLEQLLLTYQNAVLKAQQEVEDALIAFLKSQDRASSLAESTAAARKSLDLAVLQYREGTKDFTTVLAAEQALLNGQDSLTATLGTISINLVGVYRALGGGWEIRENQELIPPAIREKMARRTDWGGLLAPAAYNPPLSGEKSESLIRSPDW